MIHLQYVSLGIEIVFQGYRDKRPAFTELLQQTGLKPEQIAYMGDDVIDLPVMVQVGMSTVELVSLLVTFLVIITSVIYLINNLLTNFQRNKELKVLALYRRSQISQIPSFQEGHTP